MMAVIVKKADLNRIEVPEDYEVLDATALGRRLGFKRNTVLAYLSRRNFGRIPRPNRLLAMGPIWYEMSVKEWEAKEEDRARGKQEWQQCKDYCSSQRSHPNHYGRGPRLPTGTRALRPSEELGRVGSTGKPRGPADENVGGGGLDYTHDETAAG